MKDEGDTRMDGADARWWRQHAGVMATSPRALPMRQRESKLGVENCLRFATARLQAKASAAAWSREGVERAMPKGATLGLSAHSQDPRRRGRWPAYCCCCWVGSSSLSSPRMLFAKRSRTEWRIVGTFAYSISCVRLV